MLYEIMYRYGMLGVLAVILSLGVLLFLWIIVSALYPVVFLTPVLIVGWMAWKVKG